MIIVFTGVGFLLAVVLSSYRNGTNKYVSTYHTYINSYSKSLDELYSVAATTDLSKKQTIVTAINQCRRQLKACDFWLRYTEPNAYKRLNGPLPVEWETEVFEKYEPPYKREGAGLSLAFSYLETDHPHKDSLLALINASTAALKVYTGDSILATLNGYEQFYLCNRLFLLNLATIYSTGFECPDKQQIIPELSGMLQAVAGIYQAYNLDFTQTPLKNDYLALYQKAIDFVTKQPVNFEQFDHFTFIRDFVNPLYRINQQHMLQYNVHSKSQVDYTLNDKAASIFDKTLFWAQNSKGIYSKITDASLLQEIDSIGKLLFFDPILSGNTQRSCASCHRPEQFFTDTSVATAFQFNHTGNLARNTPSLINAVYNHLIHQDGKFLTLQDQAKGVMTNELEMGSKEGDILEKVLSVPLYKTSIKKFAKSINEKEVSLKHIISALTYYYGKFSNCYSPFDDAMNNTTVLNKNEIAGFNLFMSKAQCGTCHFAPLFSGIKPPYLNNEFEVVGVPADTFFKKLSPDNGRFQIHATPETIHAFRTPTLRNTALTKPYMHNGIFTTLEAVIDFYDAGGGNGKGLKIDNQTLAADSLHLTAIEKLQLIEFIRSLNEKVNPEPAPKQLPASKNNALNTRKVGGEY
jgi:cytochrome c peroxidase